MSYRIEPMQSNDWNQVCSIYQEGIATGNATFETEVPSWEKWDAGHFIACRLVARGQDGIIGWAALSPVSSRCVYAGVAEISVYVAARSWKQGVGGELLAALIAAAEQAGIWMLQAGVFPENRASLILHERCGFRRVGRRERLGKLHGIWRDVILLERRSKVVGVE